MAELESYVVIQTDHGEVRHELGPRAGYSVDPATSTIRVWDSAFTIVFHSSRLVELKIPNPKPVPR